MATFGKLDFCTSVESLVSQVKAKKRFFAWYFIKTAGSQSSSLSLCHIRTPLRKKQCQSIPHRMCWQSDCRVLCSWWIQMMFVIQQCVFGSVGLWRNLTTWRCTHLSTQLADFLVLRHMLTTMHSGNAHWSHGESTWFREMSLARFRLITSRMCICSPTYFSGKIVKCKEAS